MLKTLTRLLSFERLIGPPLVTIIYYFGLIGIAGMTFISLLLALMRLASDIGAGVVMAIAAPAVGAVALVLWRFFCELCMLAFANHELLREIRDRTTADYSKF